MTEKSTVWQKSGGFFQNCCQIVHILNILCCSFLRAGLEQISCVLRLYMHRGELCSPAWSEVDKTGQANGTPARGVPTSAASAAEPVEESPRLLLRKSHPPLGKGGLGVPMRRVWRREQAPALRVRSVNDDFRKSDNELIWGAEWTTISAKTIPSRNLTTSKMFVRVENPRMCDSHSRGFPF